MNDTTYHVFKAVGSDGRSFRDGAIDYIASIGQFVEVEAAPFEAGQCAAGIHVSPQEHPPARCWREEDGKACEPRTTSGAWPDCPEVRR